MGQVAAWREQELARIFRQLPLAERTILTYALRQLAEAAGEGQAAGRLDSVAVPREAWSGLSGDAGTGSARE